MTDLCKKPINKWALCRLGKNHKGNCSAEIFVDRKWITKAVKEAKNPKLASFGETFDLKRNQGEPKESFRRRVLEAIKTSE